MAEDIRQPTTEYVHPTDPNLLNIHKAMKFNNDGEPVVRTHVDGISLQGDVIVDTVSLSTSTLAALESINVQNTVSVTVSNFPTTSTVYQGTIPWIITGTVSIGSIAEIEIKNDTGNPIPVSANTLTNSNSNPIYVKGTSDTSFFSPTQSDAFGRLRVSNPFTLADHFNRYQDNAGSFNYTTGSGSVGFDINNASVTLSVNSNGSDSVARETSRVYAYQPGKSLLILQTFTFADKKTNLTQRAGYFDNANGFYLEQEGNNVSFVRRSSVTGSIVETRISQTGGIYGAGDTGWNINQLPALDLSKSQILWIDIEWLGVGSVRMGFVIDGEFIHCHTFHHANKITGTYITSACLPVRKEIFNTGTTSGPSTMLSICTSVISEGGYSITGRDFCVGTTLGSPILLSASPTTFTPIIALRLKSNRLGAIALPTSFTVTPVGQAVYKYNIHTRAISTGGTWISAGTNSSVEYNLNPTSIVTTGTISLTAFVNASNQSAGTSESIGFPFQYQLERNSFVPTCYEIIITVAASTNNTTCYGSINWTELT